MGVTLINIFGRILSFIVIILSVFFAVVFYAIQWGGLYLIFNSNSLKDLKDGIIAILLFEKEPVFPFYCMMRS